MATPTPGHPKPPPPPGNVSIKTFCITGILVDVHGLSELDPKCSVVNVLWLLHGKDLDREWMHPMAAESILAWNERRERLKQKDVLQQQMIDPAADASMSPERDLSLPLPGLVTASIDHRNHGSRFVSHHANADWSDDHEFTASDLFGTYQGTAQDVSLLIAHISSYIFPQSNREIQEHHVAGVSLGGHAAWHLLLHEPRVKSGAVFIGCADFVRLISRRAHAAQRESWTKGKHLGSMFLGSPDFPPSLEQQVKRLDPAALLAGQMFPPTSFLYQSTDVDWTRRPTAEEIEQLSPLMEKTLAGKKILNVWGRKDVWVPHSASAPFLKWVSSAIGEGGWFEDGGLVVQDLAVEDLGHECPREMYILGISWLVDVALGPI